MPNLRLLVLPLLLLVACEEGADGQPFIDLGDPQDWIDPVEYHLSAATTGAWIGMIALAHYTDGSHPCATLEADESLTLTPGPDCPHPLLDALEGTAVVQPPSATGGAFSASAAGLTVGGRTLLAQQFDTIAASPAGDEVAVGIATSDYGPSTAWSWVIQVDTAGTSDMGDDTVRVSGAVFTPEALPAKHSSGDNEVGLTSSFVVTPGCRLNPTEGSAVMEGHSDWPLLEILSPVGCDGTVQIDSTNQEAEWTPTLDLLARN